MAQESRVNKYLYKKQKKGLGKAGQRKISIEDISLSVLMIQDLLQARKKQINSTLVFKADGYDENGKTLITSGTKISTAVMQAHCKNRCCLNFTFDIPHCGSCKLC